MTLPAGARLGPYEILDLLGVGGMGEVYRARDPRLGREVAIKVLSRDLTSDPDRLARFEREARAVAALNHPNILTVHDVGTDAATPYVVTELLAGETLRELLRRRTPGERQSLLLMLQAARGLEAAHGKGIVHRDLKPENVFVTTDGRVKVLDFGLAKLVAAESAASVEETESSPTKDGMLVGTVGYMSPEQVRGLPVDARSDVFSFGVVLYELVSGKHPFRRETTVGTLSAVLEGEPAELSSVVRGVSPAVSGIVRRCLEKERERRYPSGHELAVALEAVAAAPAGSAVLQEAEEKSPYPGLMSFTERDAATFFGREQEAASLWERLRSRHLSGVIGPSGAGKTSFVRAGVVASRPPGWGTLVCTPGAMPFRGLAHALASELAGDAESVRELLRFDDPAVAFDLVSRWRRGYGEALLVVDQFEELFTLNPAEVQERFAGLLGRLAREADVHVLLSLRDDFLMKCADHEPIGRVFESLSPLSALSREGLRRAVEDPAKARGYRFEDDALVAEMVESVEGARAALPLLAFAVSRLWEKRDREKKVLPRAAYEEIGGVAGALAQHAEATMDRIGSERQGMVREIFRTMATSQGTRAVAEREELLSLFQERKAAEEVLRELVDARLLTSYEVAGAEGQPSRHRIEIVHESLLKAWPRLVRWQAQDEEGALLRDQLKQAAHLWEGKGRPADLLWSGTSYEEFELWRKLYQGALTVLEEDFARAMAERAQRRKRVRTAVVAGVLVALAGIAIAIGISRQQAMRARDVAKAEALRAEAGKLLALGRTEIDRYPTAALAYARKSLELADTPDARRFALEVLWRGPVARILPLHRIAKQMGAPATAFFGNTALSPDGKWLATQPGDGRILLFPRDGGPPRYLPATPGSTSRALAFGPRSDLLVTTGAGQSLRLLSVPELREVGSVELGGAASEYWVRGGTLFTETRASPGDTRALFRTWTLPGGEPKVLGTYYGSGPHDVDATGSWIAAGRGRTLFVRSVDASRASAERILGQLPDDVSDVAFVAGDRTVSVDKSGEIRLWPLVASGPMRVLGKTKGTFREKALDPTGRRLAVADTNASFDLWDLRDPAEAEPVALKRPEAPNCLRAVFDSTGSWLVTNNCLSVAFWPLEGRWMRTLRGQHGLSYQLCFSPDSHWLASCTPGKPAQVWPLDPMDGGLRDLLPAQPCAGITFHPAGTHVLEGTIGGGAVLYPIRKGPPRPFPTGWEGQAYNGTGAVAFDVSGHRAALGPGDMAGLKDPKLRVIRIWDLETGRSRTFSLSQLITEPSWWGFLSLRFAPDGSLYAAGQDAVRRLVLPADESGTVSLETLYSAPCSYLDLSRDGRQLLVWSTSDRGCSQFKEMLVFDLAARTSRRITSHGQVRAAALDPSGRIIVTGDGEGAARVGPVTGEEPHLLLGHTGAAEALAVSPDGRWIASIGDEALHLWPMPDVTKPPLHTLPHAELLAKLDALTNLRVVRDASSPTGWTLDVGPFPGWKDVPTW